MPVIAVLTSGESGANSLVDINANFAALNAVWFKETPTGTINGSNVTYTLTHTPIANSGMLTIQNQIYTETTDYSYTGTTLTLVTAIPNGYTGPFIFQYQYIT